jgi:hypothetical protein
MKNSITMEIRALDATHGYVVHVSGVVEGMQPQSFEEHYDTENAVKARLGALWDLWASLVNAE